MAKIMDPILPILSILRYWAISLGFLEVHASTESHKTKKSLSRPKILRRPGVQVPKQDTGWPERALRIVLGYVYSVCIYI